MFFFVCLFVFLELDCVGNSDLTFETCQIQTQKNHQQISTTTTFNTEEEEKSQSINKNNNNNNNTQSHFAQLPTTTLTLDTKYYQAESKKS